MIHVDRYVLQVGIIPSFKSYHSTIVLVINSVDNQMGGLAFWKFNLSLLG